MVNQDDLIFNYFEEYGFHGGMAARKWLTKEYLPNLDGTILFIGVNNYNAINCEIVKDPSKYYTIDIFEERSEAGGNKLYPENNFIGNFREHENVYDNICFFGCHGYEGYGIDNESILKDLKHSHSLVKDNGTFLWGPNDEIKINPVYPDGEEALDEPIAMLNFAEYLTTYPDLPFSKYEVLKKENWENLIWWGRKK